MRTSGREAGKLGLAARLAQALAQSQAQQRTPGCGVVVVRCLAAGLDAGWGLRMEQMDQRAAALDALAARVRSQARQDDAMILDPTEGLGLLVRSPHPETARLVAERLHDALAPRRDPRSARRKTPYGADTMPVEALSAPMLRPMLRLGVGYATLGADDDSAVETIHAAWRPRMLLSVSFAALLARAITGSERPLVDDGAPEETTSVPPVEEAAAAPGTVSLGRLRLLRWDGLSAQECEALRQRARSLGVPYMRLPARLSASARRALSPSLARELRAVAIGRTRASLTVAMANPRDTSAVLRLRAATGLAIFPVLAAPTELDRALGQLG